MKRAIAITAVFLFVMSPIFGARVGRSLVQPWDGSEEKVFRVPAMPFHLGFFAGPAAEVFYFNAEIERGNLRLLNVQPEPMSGVEHHRYQQYFSGLEVPGGEIILHFKDRQLQDMDGEYYLIREMELKPGLTPGQAADFFRRYLNDPDLREKAEESKLVVFPVRDGDYRLAYRVVLERGAAYSMTGFVDASSGEVLNHFSNVKSETLTIGTGVGVHGEKLKLSTNFENGKYWLMDKALNRPVRQYTYYKQANSVLTDTDNVWEQDSASTSVHAYMGLTYNYYYQARNRHGMDNHNLSIRAIVHFPGGTDNAFWNGNTQMMYFLDPGTRGFQTAAALDVIAHEFSHGVTQFTSNLVYANESGALNESFSDIMGTAVEFRWQAAGAGFCLADYYIGEDIFTNYGYALRNLVNPNLNGDPCHLTQKKNLPNTEAGDWGGVHVNCTIYGHAYYLLANGGTNPISKMSVAGIGVEKATNIFYSAFTAYLTPASKFINAASALLKSASVLYGSASNEYQETVKAMQAIGWTVK